MVVVIWAVYITEELLSRVYVDTDGPLSSVIGTVPYTAMLVPLIWEVNFDLIFVSQKYLPLKENCAVAPFDVVPCSDVLYSWETPFRNQLPENTIRVSVIYNCLRRVNLGVRHGGHLRPSNMTLDKMFLQRGITGGCNALSKKMGCQGGNILCCSTL